MWLISKPGTPLSIMVGTFGASAVRWGDVTASARICPASASGMIATNGPNIICTCPPTRSVVACDAPLYGTCRMSTPAARLKNSAARCSVEPIPAEP